jgi:hypothetical protein
VKERPILFSAPMVRAILDGRKTQTRRIVTVPWRGSSRALPYEPYYVDTDGELRFCDEYGDYHPIEDTMQPYGVVGDRLWVKETHALRSDIDGNAEPDRARHYAMFRADEAGDPADPNNWHDYGRRWRPSIFMPRWLSRITLEIADVRVQRVQAISSSEAKAEGVGVSADDPLKGTGAMDAMSRFASLWDAINGKRAPWADNPWVWAITFRRLP